MGNKTYIGNEFHNSNPFMGFEMRRIFLSVVALVVPFYAMFTFAENKKDAAVSEKPSCALNAAQKEIIAETLAMRDMTIKDLSYKKKMVEDAYRLPVVDRLMENPLDFPEVADEIVDPLRNARKPLEVFLKLIEQYPGGKIGDLPATEGKRMLPSPNLKGFPDGLDEALRNLWNALLDAKEEKKKSFSELTPEESKLLKDVVPILVCEEIPRKIQIPEELEKNPAKIWELIKKVHYGNLWRSAAILMRGIDLFLAETAGKCENWKGELVFENTDAKLIIAGMGDDVHKDKADLIIDFGGDDIYKDAATESWIVDLAGNDLYEGGNVCIGAGILDVGLLWDMQGDDVYRAGAMTQGFGAFGCGMLFDEGGNDFYKADLYAQGSSRTWGLGLLADRSGNDVYESGGLVLHKPLLDNLDVCFSFSQGFSIGYRPDASGGIGILWDGAGKDTYSGETFCQGSSYWFSLGLLVDDGGNDKYSAFYYSQASAMHLTAAALMDLKGNDFYGINIGAAHAIGHDWGVAMLLDKQGNDVYAASANSPGAGIANGVGIFLDLAGDDYYLTGKPGCGTPARDSGSVGLFIDMAGKDSYKEGLKDNSVAFNDQWGIARDLNSPSEEEKKSETTMDKKHGKPGSLPLPSEEEVQKLYRDATIWGVGSSAETAWNARNKLVEIGLPAAKWMAENKLAKISLSGLDYDCLFPVFKEVGPEANEFLRKPLKSDSQEEVINTLVLAREIKAEVLGDEILALMRKYKTPSSPEEKKIRNLAVLTAGSIKLKSAVSDIIEIAKNSKESEQLSIVVALKNIAAPEAVDFLLEKLNSRELPIREAAVEALVNTGSPAALGLRKTVSENAGQAGRLAMKVLGAMNDTDSIPLLGGKAGDGDWKVRVAAIGALKAMKDLSANEAARKLLAAEKDQKVIQILNPQEKK